MIVNKKLRPSCKNNQRDAHCLISDCPPVSVLGHTFTRFGHRKCSKFFRIECLVTFVVQQELCDAYGDEQCSKSPMESLFTNPTTPTGQRAYMRNLCLYHCSVRLILVLIVSDIIFSLISDCLFNFSLIYPYCSLRDSSSIKASLS